MWKSVCCEIQGISHHNNGTPCQDKTYEVNRRGTHVIALADGAGSAKLSHFGAQRTVQTIAEYMVDHFQECFHCEDGVKVKQNLLEIILSSLFEEAEVHDCGIQDLASTLLLAATTDEDFILVHIGDGIIGCLDGDNLKVVSYPDNGEFSNETTFVTSQNVLRSMRIFKGSLKNKNAFLLMSDGTAHSFYHKPSRTLANVIVKLMHRTSLLEHEVMKDQLEEAFQSVVIKKTNDDCSMAILARPSETLRPINLLSLQERQNLYGIQNNTCSIQKRISRYDTILALATTSCSLEQISRMIHLKQKYAKKHVNRLIELGLLTKEGTCYRKV